MDLGRPRGLEKSSPFRYNIPMNRNCTDKQIPVVKPGTYNNISAAALIPVKEPMNDAIVIAVDGISYAESLWLNDPGKVSRMARIIYEILDSLSRQGRSFYLHFLSTWEPELLASSRFNGPASLEQFLRQRRKDLKLPLRGNFHQYFRGIYLVSRKLETYSRENFINAYNLMKNNFRKLFFTATSSLGAAPLMVNKEVRASFDIQPVRVVDPLLIVLSEANHF
jgi:hypothetical protein